MMGTYLGSSTGSPVVGILSIGNSRRQCGLAEIAGGFKLLLGWVGIGILTSLRLILL